MPILAELEPWRLKAIGMGGEAFSRSIDTFSASGPKV